MTGKPHIAANQTSERDREVENLKGEILALRSRVAEQVEEINRLDELAETDPLTGIGNRRSFDKEIARRHSEQKRDGRGFCLMIIDVDGFKGINDQFGHGEGDRLLQMIANVVETNIRASDIVYRIGGDEFAIILPGSQLEQAEHVARRLVDKTVKMIQQHMGDVPVALSIGLVQSKADSATDQLVAEADQAMYSAKKQGGNRYSTSG